MTVFPGEVRDEEEGMEDKTDCVIQPLVVAKSVVAAFVGYDPDTSQDTALTRPIEGPSHIRERLREEREVIGGDVVEAGGYNDVSDKVGERARDRAFETMRRDCFLKISHRERRFLAGHTL